MKTKTKSNVKPSKPSTMKNTPPKKSKPQTEETLFTSSKLDQYKEKINYSLSSVKEHTFFIGQYLFKAKEVLLEDKDKTNKDFLQWAYNEFSFKKSTVYNLINVYVACYGYEDKIRQIPNAVLYKISRRSFPKKLREFLLNNYQELKSLDNDTLKEIRKLCNDEKIKDLSNTNIVMSTAKFYQEQHYYEKLLYQDIRQLSLIMKKLEKTYKNLTLLNPHNISKNVYVSNDLLYNLEQFCKHISSFIPNLRHISEHDLEDNDEINLEKLALNDKCYIVNFDLDFLQKIKEDNYSSSAIEKKEYSGKDEEDHDEDDDDEEDDDE